MPDDFHTDTPNFTNSTNSPLVYVFQCKQCKSIIADSLAWVCSNEELASITLNAIVPNVIEQSTEMRTSKSGITIGSTYSILSCLECHSQLGKLYHTTTKPFDHIRDNYTLSLDALITYQLGNTPNSQQSTNQSILSIPMATTLKSSLIKTQNLFKLLYDFCQQQEHDIQTIQSYLGLDKGQNHEKPARISGNNNEIPSFSMTEMEQDGSGNLQLSNKNFSRPPKRQPPTEMMISDSDGLTRFVTTKRVIVDKSINGQQTLPLTRSTKATISTTEKQSDENRRESFKSIRGRGSPITKSVKRGRGRPRNNPT